MNPLRKTELEKPLGEAELEIMEVLWQVDYPVEAPYIVEHLKTRSHLAVSSVMATLSRMCQRGIVMCDRSQGRNRYSALLTKKEFVGKEREKVISQLYDNSFQAMVAGLINADELSQDDIKELKELLDQIGEE